MHAIARLVIQSGGEGLLLLRPGRFIIGRHSDCDLIVNCHEVSRHHAILDVTDSSIQLHDQGSRNGTLVNGKPVEKCLLTQGSLVQIGPALCLFEWLDRRAFSDEYPTPAMDFSPETDRSLTQAELRVLAFLLGGLTEKAVASKLSLSRHTIHNHVKSIYATYQVTSRGELLARFLSSAVRTKLPALAESRSNPSPP